MTAIPTDIVKVSYNFDLMQGNSALEHGVFGFHMRLVHNAGNEVDWGSLVGLVATKARDKFVAGFSTADFTGHVKMNNVSVYHLNELGKTLDKGIAAFADAEAFQGTSGQNCLPWETSLCVSLYGYDPAQFDPLAKYKRGRFYLPPLPASQLGVNGRWNGPPANTVLFDKVLAWLNDVSGMEADNGVGNIGSDTLDIGILSRTKGIFTPWQKMIIGDVWDVQKRRQRALTEVRTIGARAD